MEARNAGAVCGGLTLDGMGDASVEVAAILAAVDGAGLTVRDLLVAAAAEVGIDLVYPDHA